MTTIFHSFQMTGGGVRVKDIREIEVFNFFRTHEKETFFFVII